jgi:5-methylcytosine-specific restriction endonuclease McrA
MSRARNEFSAKTKVQAFDRAGGCCEECGVTIRPGNGPEFDHIVPDAIGGGNDLNNCRVLCRPCHGTKTAKHDIPAISKTKRIAAKHIGAKTPSRNPLPGGRNGRFKRKINGTVEDRLK